MLLARVGGTRKDICPQTRPNSGARPLNNERRNYSLYLATINEHSIKTGGTNTQAPPYFWFTL
ncbi:hypothetical protein JOC48_004124 [Aquibacillus albus]|uniref:Uncharacterized protein n=1 Tax=Aquibacillus albus TaxID=1168171 RepID=A0ABS2N5Y9_9BACI|nr:hypothetical protein [Aquibacillus albus]